MWPHELLTIDLSLPIRRVTHAEFIAALAADGASLSDAEFQAKMAVGLGSMVRVGGEYLEIEVTA